MESFSLDWWDDLQNGASKALGVITNNPILKAQGDAVDAANEALKKAGVDKTITVKDLNEATTDKQKTEISTSVTTGLADIIPNVSGTIKWLLIITIIIILIALFYRVSGK